MEHVDADLAAKSRIVTLAARRGLTVVEEITANVDEEERLAGCYTVTWSEHAQMSGFLDDMDRLAERCDAVEKVGPLGQLDEFYLNDAYVLILYDHQKKAAFMKITKPHHKTDAPF